MKNNALALVLAVGFFAMVLSSDAVGEQPQQTPKPLKEQIDALGFDEIVFAVRQPGRDGHWYANFSHRCENPSRILYGDGGRLCALNIKTLSTALGKGPKLRTLLDDPRGGVRDPQMHYDGKKMVFSYRKGGQPYYHLYEINVDGSGLKQLTSGPFDDFEPAYLPDGGIIFCSSRIRCNVPCYYTRVAVLYRCDADPSPEQLRAGGKNIRRLSANVEHENTPWVLPDGRILYQRWEYVDRSQVQFHHLWTTNPDGTGQTIYFGNMHGGGAFLDAKPIPGSEKVAMIHSPGHGRREHEGYVEIVDPRDGPDRKANARRITPRAQWRDPYPVSKQAMLIAGPGHHQISLLGTDGKALALFKLSEKEIKARMWVHEPRPIRKRARERLIPSRVDLTQGSGTVILQDVYVGRNMKGVKRGDIKKLLVMEVLHMPVKPNRDWQQMVSFDGGTGGSFSLERVVGTVPVEADGSAHFKAPALRPLFFIAMDENNLSVKRMQSFMTVQPGESISCVGCHEERVGTPPVTRNLLAMKRRPDTIKPVKGIPHVFDYPRDIQPILDKHCIKCHGAGKDKPKAGLDLRGTPTRFFSNSYERLLNPKYLPIISENHPKTGNVHYLPARSLGSHNSLLVAMLSKGKVKLKDPKRAELAAKLAKKHKDRKLTPQELLKITTWVDTNGQFYGMYWGRKNLVYKDHPNFRPIPTFKRAISTKSLIPEGKR